MKIKNKISIYLLTILTFSTFFVSAYSGFTIKGETQTKVIDSGSVFIKSVDNLKKVDIDNITISELDETVAITPTPVDPPVVKPTITKGYVNTVEGLNVRSGPGTSYSILGAIVYKSSINIVAKDGSWYKISYGNGYGFVLSDYVTTESPVVTPTTPDKKPASGKIKKVVIDAGHGGIDPGAIGPSGLKEKDVVLDVSLKLKNILEANGISVIMTRTTDITLSLEERVVISNKSNADFFISVHANSFTNATANGTETFSYTNTGFSYEMSQRVQANLISFNGLVNRSSKVANFHVLRQNNKPAILTELAFLSNPTEEALLANSGFRTKSAEQIAKAIINYK